MLCYSDLFVSLYVQNVDSEIRLRSCYSSVVILTDNKISLLK